MNLVESTGRGPLILRIANMSHGRRLAVTEAEDFQVWIEKNWDRPLSDEAEHLQDELKRARLAALASLPWK